LPIASDPVIFSRPTVFAPAIVAISKTFRVDMALAAFQFGGSGLSSAGLLA
jgi:hypothetical protein